MDAISTAKYLEKERRNRERKHKLKTIQRGRL